MHNVLSTRNAGAEDDGLELLDCQSRGNSVRYECDDNAVISRVHCDPNVPYDSLRSSVRKSVHAHSKKLRESIRNP